MGLISNAFQYCLGKPQLVEFMLLEQMIILRRFIIAPLFPAEDGIIIFQGCNFDVWVGWLCQCTESSVLRAIVAPKSRQAGPLQKVLIFFCVEYRQFGR